jgi:glyoxylase-like metal-dependent hydrolase (beta-lactamase superfamily II)
VVIVPTPGHTPHHVSVVVRGTPSYLLAADTSYNQELLLAGVVDGVRPDMKVARQTHERIRELGRQEPLVYLPSHDAAGAERLANDEVLASAPHSALA